MADKDVKYAELAAETFDLDTVTINIKEFKQHGAGF